MSSSGTSEEKSLPPSAKKLKDLRKKGQISRSTDIIVAFTTVGSFLYLWMSFSSFVASYRSAVWRLIGIRQSDFHSAASEGVIIFTEELGGYVAVLVLLVVLLVIVGNIIVNKGFLFSFDPIKLDLNKLNPVEGFKRMVSLRSLIDIVKNLIKITLFLSISVFVLWFSIRAPLYVPYCGMTCFETVMSSLITPILMAASAILILGGILDISIQQWLFKRQQRMTKTEMKRERKDQDGSPEVKQSQKRARQRLLRENTQYSEKDATLFIEGTSAIVGLRFVRGETPLPIVVCKAKGGRSSAILSHATASKTPVFFDDEFADGLFGKIEVGNPINEAFFEPFINAFKATA